MKILALVVIAHAIDDYQHSLKADQTHRKFDRDALKRDGDLARKFLFEKDDGEERSLSWWLKVGGFHNFINPERVRMLAKSGRRLPCFNHGIQNVINRDCKEIDPDVEAAA